MIAWRSNAALCSVEATAGAAWAMNTYAAGSETPETTRLVEQLTAILDDELDGDDAASVVRASEVCRTAVRRTSDVLLDAEDAVAQLVAVERVWALCEAALLSCDAGARAGLLARWLREVVVDEAVARDELEAMVPHFERLEYPEAWRPADDPADELAPFWRLVYSLIARGDGEDAWAVLNTHSSANDASPHSRGWADVADVLRDMPRGVEAAQAGAWARWQRRAARLRRETALGAAAPELRPVLAALDGDAADMAPFLTWEERLLARLLYAAPSPADLDSVVAAAAQGLPRDCFGDVSGGDDVESRARRALVGAVYDGDAATAVRVVYELGGDVGVLACAAGLARLCAAAGLLDAPRGGKRGLADCLAAEVAQRAEASPHCGWAVALKVLGPRPQRGAQCLATLRRARPAGDADALALAAALGRAGLAVEARCVLAQRGDAALRSGDVRGATKWFVRAEGADDEATFAADGHLERLCADAANALVAALQAELQAESRGGDSDAGDAGLRDALGICSALAECPRSALGAEASFLAAYAQLAAAARRAARGDDAARDAAAQQVAALLAAAHPPRCAAHLLSLVAALLRRGAALSSLATLTARQRLVDLDASARGFGAPLIDAEAHRWLEVALARELVAAYVRENRADHRAPRTAPPAPPAPPVAFELSAEDLLGPAPL
ncbi:Nup85 nucleoporin-domain-containing protein [Pelagophyceae sp. CCMP2097]|nr:Nup85 nucleoporin-domain-containing protein [Pelagophyceae sp. CCMP2097]